MVSAVFLGLGPSLVGWSLIEITARSLFALNRPWPPVLAIAIPVAGERYTYAAPASGAAGVVGGRLIRGPDGADS